MAEALNLLYKVGLVRNEGLWQPINDLEVATAEYFDWWNERRFHGELTQRFPAEAESNYSAAKTLTPELYKN